MSVLMVIKTTGLQYDDRLRKEAESLRDLGVEVSIVGLEYANQSARLTVYDGIPAATVRLRSRGWLGQGRGLALKTAEMHLRFLGHVVRTRPDVVWCHDLVMFALVPVLALLRACGLIRRIVWDQHELPSDALLKSRAFRRAYAWTIGLCDRVVMANRERRAFVLKWLGNLVKTPIEVIENYPDRRFAELPERELPQRVAGWLEGSPYLLAQGGANPDRHLDKLVASALQTRTLKLIVVGPYRPQILRRLECVHGSRFRDRVLFTGPVPQLELTRFIDRAYASVVLYQADSANTRLCAPNRLYQALVRGVPVVVGANPPMAEVVRRLDCGVVLHGDGGDVSDLCDGFRRLEATYRECAHNATRRREITWESQRAIIAHTVGPMPAVRQERHENSLSPASCE